MTAKRRPERIAMRIDKGCMRPADGFATARLRARGYHTGDVVFAEFKKPRNPGYHRLAHALGKLVANNIESFEGMNPHRVLKRLQMESGAGCEEIAYLLAGQTVVQRIPLSLSFESMEQGEFEEVFRALCRRVCDYWPGVNEQAIANMAEMMPEEA